jgi:formate dehydrogenase subunit delta
MSHDTKLVYMVNQIGKFFAHQSPEKAIESIADHLLKFWDPRMRQAIVGHVDKGGDTGLAPLALKAVEKVRERDRQKWAARPPS